MDGLNAEYFLKFKPQGVDKVLPIYTCSSHMAGTFLNGKQTTPGEALQRMCNTNTNLGLTGHVKLAMLHCGVSVLSLQTASMHLAAGIFSLCGNLPGKFGWWSNKLEQATLTGIDVQN